MGHLVGIHKKSGSHSKPTQPRCESIEKSQRKHQGELEKDRDEDAHTCCRFDDCHGLGRWSTRVQREEAASEGSQGAIQEDAQRGHDQAFPRLQAQGLRQPGVS